MKIIALTDDEAYFLSDLVDRARSSEDHPELNMLERVISILNGTSNDDSSKLVNNNPNNPNSQELKASIYEDRTRMPTTLVVGSSRSHLCSITFG